MNQLNLAHGLHILIAVNSQEKFLNATIAADDQSGNTGQVIFHSFFHGHIPWVILELCIHLFCHVTICTDDGWYTDKC
jgi:hypothetical protein